MKAHTMLNLAPGHIQPVFNLCLCATTIQKPRPVSYAYTPAQGR